MTEDPDPTAPVRRRASAADDPAPGAHAAGAPDDATEVRPRRGAPQASAPRSGPETGQTATQPDLEESTRISSGGVRRATGAADVPAPVGRIARTPAPHDRTYAAGSAPRPVVVPRSAGPGPGHQDPVDGAAAAARHRRRARRRMIGAAAAALLAVAAVVAVLIVLVAV